MGRSNPEFIKKNNLHCLENQTSNICLGYKLSLNITIKVKKLEINHPTYGVSCH